MADQLNDLNGIDLFVTYPKNGIYVISDKNIKATFLISRNILSYPGTVKLQQVFSEERPAQLSQTFQFHKKADEYILLEHLHSKKGMWKKFWYMFPVQAFSLSQAYVSSATELIVHKNEFSEVFRGFERIYFLLKNKDLITTKISSVAPGPGAGELTLNLNTPISRAIGLEDYIRISLLLLVRFDTDKFKFKYKSPTIGKIETKLVELVQEYP